MKGVLIEFLLQPDARRLAGLSDDIELPPMRFALHEGMARKLIEAIARRLEYPDENGETVH